MNYSNRSIRLVLSAALFAGVGLPLLSAVAQEAPPAAPAAAPQPAFPDFNQSVKDMIPSPGLLTLFRYRAEDLSKDQSRLLAAIPRALLKQDLLLAISNSRGDQMGFPGETFLVRFEQSGRKIMLVVPDVRYVQAPGQPVTDAVNKTYTSGFLAALPIISMSPQGDPLVDLGSMLMSGMGLGGVNPRRDVSEFTKVKVFPDNALIDVDLGIAGPAGSGQHIGISYDFRRLPAIGTYQPRKADERVGYFTTVRQDWNLKHSEREIIVRYVDRWDVKKKDPSLEMSPPEKPIVFIIEKTVPLQWRKWVAEGILEWNKAYEKLGIVGAIVVQQQADDNEFANVDPEDARYNFIRWIVTGREFAMGPHRSDPRTGQILDADIIFDDSMLRHYHESFDIFGPGPMAAMLGPELPQFLLDNPAFIPNGQTIEQVKQAAELSGGELMYNSGSAAIRVDGKITSVRPQTACSLAVGLKHQLALAHWAVSAAAAPGKKIPDRFIGEVVREIVAHEVGHTLGLRHNFKASSWLGLDEIRRRRDSTDEATCASVMDYNPVLYFPGDDPEKVRHFVTPTLGPYDYFAIEYGYKQATGQDEKAMLLAIASQGTKPELSFATDEDTMGLSSPDPMSNRFDYSNDPLAWAKMRTALADSLLKDIRKWAVKNGDPNHYLQQTYRTILFEKARNMAYVSRLVSGQMHNRNRPGDPSARPAFVLIDPKKQREALALMSETIFKDDYLVPDPDLLVELGPSRWSDWASESPRRLDYPIHQNIANMQAQALLAICSPSVVQRVYDSELKTKAADKFTAAELITRVREMVWGNLALADSAKFTDAQPMLTSIRRNLQKQHLQYVLALSESDGQVSPDVQSMARTTLRDLADNIGQTLEKSKSPGGSRLDFATRAHLTECRSQIDRALNAPIIKQAAGGGPTIVIRGQEKQLRE